jgi:hypothetical protein
VGMAHIDGQQYEQRQHRFVQNATSSFHCSTSRVSLDRPPHLGRYRHSRAEL